MMDTDTLPMVQPHGETDMKRLMTLLSAAGLFLALAISSWGQATMLPTHTVTMAGTVETIDHAKRVVTIRTDAGERVTVDVPEGATRFNELKVGDKVKATYNNTVIAILKPLGEPPVDTSRTLSVGGGRAAWGRDGDGEVDDRDRRRDRQESVVDHLRSVRTDGTTAVWSPIRMCSISSRWAIRLTSCGTRTSRSQWSSSGRTSLTVLDLLVFWTLCSPTRGRPWEVTPRPGLPPRARHGRPGSPGRCFGHASGR